MRVNRYVVNVRMLFVWCFSVDYEQLLESTMYDILDEDSVTEDADTLANLAELGIDVTELRKPSGTIMSDTSQVIQLFNDTSPL